MNYNVDILAENIGELLLTTAKEVIMRQRKRNKSGYIQSVTNRAPWMKKKKRVILCQLIGLFCKTCTRVLHTGFIRKITIKQL